MYSAGGRLWRERQISEKLLKWGTKEIENLPARCSGVICGDMNARLGSVQVDSICGKCLIGGWQQQGEGLAGGKLREWATRHQLEVVNTTHERAAGPTWSGGRHKISRLDYIMVPADGEIEVLDAWVNYRAAHGLQLARSLHWLDHAPVQIRIVYRGWWDPEAAERAESISKRATATVERSEELKHA